MEFFLHEYGELKLFSIIKLIPLNGPTNFPLDDGVSTTSQ